MSRVYKGEALMVIRYNTPVYNRIFERDGKKSVINFFNSGKIKVSVKNTFFSKEEYEKAAFSAGFKNTKWVKLKISKEGLNKMGQKFWKGYEKDCPYIAIIATK
jgi:hypothetical protein